MPWKCIVTASLLATLLLPRATIAAPVANETTWPTRGWETSTPEAQGLDAGRLARLVENIGAGKQDSLLIARHGKIVLDAYYAPYAPGILHDLRSVTKSINGTLVAIAVKNGMIDSIDHPVVDFFPDRQIANLDYRKKAITVQQLLDMTSGISWQEKNYSGDEAVQRMYRSRDRINFVLNQPMSDAPGARFDYNSGDSYLLSALITKQTGLGALEYARRELFAPLGIIDVDWRQPDTTGIRDGSSGLSLTPHDMAKIGYLYLRHGQWDGQQIIPASWIDRVAEGTIPATFDNHYANQWWSIPEKGAYMARGRHSQLIMVLPKLDIVVVTTGTLRDDEFYSSRRLIDDIAAAVKSDGALPDDAAAQSLLAAAIQNAAVERPSARGETPPLAAAISGKTYQFSNNNLHMQSFALNLVGADPSWQFSIPALGDEPGRTFGGPLGLDGSFKKSTPTLHGIDAVKGRWVNTNTLEIERRILGHGETQVWRLAFADNKVIVNFENTDGFTSEIHGEQAGQGPAH
ncbi:MAG: beta-lactamase [Tardiphaga sp.]|jgi:CubicO group peptidase (beta-lactamase class C family)|nr:beta-lactamase [Tardiphaga sp.]